MEKRYRNELRVRVMTNRPPTDLPGILSPWTGICFVSTTK